MYQILKIPYSLLQEKKLYLLHSIKSFKGLLKNNIVLSKTNFRIKKKTLPV